MKFSKGSVRQEIIEMMIKNLDSSISEHERDTAYIKTKNISHKNYQQYQLKVNAEQLSTYRELKRMLQNMGAKDE